MPPRADYDCGAPPGRRPQLGEVRKQLRLCEPARVQGDDAEDVEVRLALALVVASCIIDRSNQNGALDDSLDVRGHCKRGDHPIKNDQDHRPDNGFEKISPAARESDAAEDSGCNRLNSYPLPTVGMPERTYEAISNPATP
jgi:hypothetical protein